MTAAQERLLEYALQVHYGRVVARDLKQQILRTWERGVPGSSLEDLLPPPLEYLSSPELPAQPRPWRRNTLRDRAPWLCLSAALVLLLFYGAYQWWNPPSAPVAPAIAQVESGRAPREPQQAQQVPPKVSVDRSSPQVAEIAQAELLFRRMIWADISGLEPPFTFARLSQSSQRAMVELAGMLATRPPLWEVLDPYLRETMGDVGADAEVRMVLLDLCTREGSLHAVELAREFWLKTPASFHVEHLVALAESGASEFEQELAALVEDGVGFEGQARVVPAAFFAFRGDRRGEAILREGLALAEYSRSEVPLPLLACLALSDLGDESVWSGVLERVYEEHLSLLSSGREDLLLPMVTATEYFLRLRQSHERPKLSALGDELDAWLGQRKEALSSRAALREAVQELRGR